MPTSDNRPTPAADTVYSLTILDYLVKGGDDYEGSFSPTTATVPDPLSDVFTDVIGADTAKSGVVRVPPKDGRITRVG